MAQTDPVVLVVAYGRPDLLDSALDGLGSGHLVLVIDNSRSDEVAAVAHRHAAQYLRSAGNIGFAAAVNIGLRHAEHARDVLLLNPDARLSWPEVLALQQAMGAVPRLAAVAPALVRPDGTAERTSWPIPRPFTTWRGVIGRAQVRDADSVFLSGAVLLLRAEALREVGHLDERFFLYAEECDWQQRALLRGWSVREVPTVIALHVGAATSNDPDLRAAYFHAAAERFLRKWHGPLGWQLFRVGAMVSALRRLVVPGIRNTEVRLEQVRALRLYWRGPVRCLRARGLR